MKEPPIKDSTTFHVVGYSFKNEAGVERKKIIEKIIFNKTVSLKLDDNNEHDPNAIKVYWKGNDIGWVKATQNKKIRKFLIKYPENITRLIDIETEYYGKNEEKTAIRKVRGEVLVYDI